MTLFNESLAVLIAGLDGHNPRSKDTSIGKTTTQSTDPSELDIAVSELFDNVHPQWAVKDVARGAHDVMMATAVALGHGMFDVNSEEVANILRRSLSTIAHGQEGDQE